MNYDIENELKDMEKDIRDLTTAKRVGSTAKSYSYTHRYDATPTISGAYDYRIVFEAVDQPIIVSDVNNYIRFLEPSGNTVKFHTDPQAPTTFYFLSTRKILRIEQVGNAS